MITDEFKNYLNAELFIPEEVDNVSTFEYQVLIIK